MPAELNREHPAVTWQRDARDFHQAPKSSLRLAAMAGHMGLDRIAARRASLVDFLADGRPHPREEIWEKIACQLGEDPWGKLPQEALARDLAALRHGGLRIGYSRRPGLIGYYLQHPPLKRSPTQQFGAIDWELIEKIRQLSVPEKNRRAFAAANFAIDQKRLILAEEHPDWPAEDVEREARRLVFGVSNEASR